MISFKDVSVKYRGSHKDSLSNVNLDIYPGHLTLLAGPSGSGKSSLLRLVNGLVPLFYEAQVQGRVEFFGQDMKEMDLEEISSRVGSVFQDPKSQFFCLNSTEEMTFACGNQGMDPRETLSRLARLVEDLGLAGLLNRDLLKLSGGQRQIVSCISAILPGQKVLALDEPTANLDEEGIQSLKRALAHLKAKGTTIIVAEHRLAYLKDLLDQVVLLKEGRISQVLNKQAFLQMTDKDLHDLGLRGLDLMPIKVTSPPEGQAAGGWSFRNLKISRGAKTLLEIPSLAFGPGRVTGIWGPNGTGKTSLALRLAGLIKGPGRAYFKGQEVRSKELKSLVYLLFQDTNHQIFTESVEDELALAGAKDPQDLDIIEDLGLSKKMDSHPMALSGGEKQRLAFACAFLSGRNLVILDEPSSGLDYFHMDRLAGWIKRMKEAGRTLVLISHDRDLVARTCDYVYPVMQGIRPN